MRSVLILFLLMSLIFTSCLDLEEEPIVQINPAAEISAHVKNQRIYATALVNVNAQVLSVGNIPVVYEFSGELEIFDTNTGNPIDVSSISGDGLAQSFTVSADTTSRKRFVVVAKGSVDAYADIGNDGKESNDRLISSGSFYQEAQYLLVDLVPEVNN